MSSADNRTTARRTMIVIGMLLVTVVGMFLIYETRRVLVWMLISGFFAVALHPVVTWVENRARWCRRWLATLLVFVVSFVALAGLITLFVVPLAQQGSQLADQWPGLVNDLKAGRGTFGGLAERFHLREYAASHSEQLRDYATSMGAPALSVLRGAATTIAGVLTIVVLAYLMVLQAPKLIEGILSVFPADRAERIRRVGDDCAKTITGYISGNLLISVICGSLTYATLKIMGVPFAGLIAVFVGIADLIPLVGATLGAVIAGLAAFIHSTTAGIVVVVFFIVYQQLENHLLQPVIFARTVKLNPLTVLIAILVGVELAGILGALAAIPVAGMIQIIALDTWNNRRDQLDAAPDGTPAGAPAETPVGRAELG